MDEDFKTTTSHTVIQSWVEKQGGKPAMIVDPNRLDKRVGLRIDFPGKQDEVLLSQAHRNKDVTWDEFFKAFEDQDLAFDFMPDPADTELPDAYRFIKRTALKDSEAATPFNPEEFAKAIREDEPAFFVHDGKAHKPEDEGQLGGSNTDQEADDDTTQGVVDLGIVDPDDAQAKHDR